MRKSLYIAVLSVVLPFAVNSAQAHEIGDSFYGRANVKIGYTFQGYTGEVKDIINDAKDNGLDTNKFTHAVNIGIGYDIYYKLSKSINLFAGLEAQGRIPFVNKIVKAGDDSQGILEIFRFNARLGAKMIACKDVAFAPYALLGLNVMYFELGDSQAQISAISTGVDHTTIEKDNSLSSVGISTGAGIETIIKNRFTVGVEYRYGLNKFSNEDEPLKIKSHNFAVNLGVQFL